MEEIWRDIPQYKGMYQASNLGRIRSTDRKITQLANGGKTEFTYVKKRKNTCTEHTKRRIFRCKYKR